MDMKKIKNINEVYALANRVFKDEGKVKEWMFTPLPALSYLNPEDLLDNSRDIKRVLEVLRKIERGEFS